MSRDKSEIECAGCSAVLYSQKTGMESWVHYNSRTGDLWHLICWEEFKEFLDSMSGVVAADLVSKK